MFRRRAGGAIHDEEEMNCAGVSTSWQPPLTTPSLDAAVGAYHEEFELEIASRRRIECH
jgi:hypothetical protein